MPWEEYALSDVRYQLIGAHYPPYYLMGSELWSLAAW
jgi:hypothetical protein